MQGMLTNDTGKGKSSCGPRQVEKDQWISPVNSHDIVYIMSDEDGMDDIEDSQAVY